MCIARYSQVLFLKGILIKEVFPGDTYHKKILWSCWKPMCPMVKQIHVQGSVLFPHGFRRNFPWWPPDPGFRRETCSPNFFWGMKLQTSFLGLLDSKGKVRFRLTYGYWLTFTMFVIGSALKKQWQGGQAKRSRIYTQTDPRLPATILVKTLPSSDMGV